MNLQESLSIMQEFIQLRKNAAPPEKWDLEGSYDDLYGDNGHTICQADSKLIVLIGSERFMKACEFLERWCER